MPCYHPLKAYQDQNTGSISFSANYGDSTQINLPCGQCVGCRLERSRQWAIRCHHESLQSENNSFITLTYNNENLPHDHSLNKSHFQKFIKRLRKNNNEKIRYYHCGEYGEATPENDFIARPHYHALLFNKDWNDKTLYKTENNIPLYTSDRLSDLWGKGFVTTGDVTFESAAYCARYIMKKVNGKRQEEHYTRTDYTTGEIINLQPEYTTMSNGIGARWLEEYKHDIYRDDFIIYDSKKFRPPKYYDNLYSWEYPETLDQLKILRQEKMSKHKKDLTPERLYQREAVQLAKLKQLKRTL